MRLNPNCVRDILLTVEEKLTDPNSPVPFTSDAQHARLAPYSISEIGYHLKQCELSGLVDIRFWTEAGTGYVSGLRPRGHDFIANTRDISIWQQALKIAESIGSDSLQALITISERIITDRIDSQF